MGTKVSAEQVLFESTTHVYSKQFIYIAAHITSQKMLCRKLF